MLNGDFSANASPPNFGGAWISRGRRICRILREHWQRVFYCRLGERRRLGIGINGNPLSGLWSSFSPSNYNGDPAQFAFLQNYSQYNGAGPYNGAYISQDITGLTVGESYTLTYDDASRAGDYGVYQGYLTAAVGSASQTTAHPMLTFSPNR